MRLRKPDELQADPRFAYMVGRLVGCCEMLARYLEVHGDDEAKLMGDRAGQILGFFFEQESE